MQTDRIIYDYEAEQAVLGAMMEQGNQIPVIATILTDDRSFWQKSHQIIYSAIRKVYEANGTSDVMLVAKEIKDTDKVNIIGGLPYLHDLLVQTVDASHARYYAEIVEENYKRRCLLKIGSQFQEMAYDTQKEFMDIIDDATQSVARMIIPSSRSPWIPDVMNETFLKMQEAKDSEVAQSLETGLYDLDEKHSINEIGGMTTITADSGGGKTTLIRNIMLHRFQQGFKTLMFPTEVTEDLMAMSYFAMMSGIPFDTVRKIKQKKIKPSEEQWQKLDEINRNVGFMTGWMESGNLSIEYIKNRAREIKGDKGFDCLVVDYVQNIYSSKYESNRSLQIDYVVNQLKMLAVDLKLNVIIASQLSMSDRRYAKRDDTTSGEGAWSGGIRNNSDVLIRLRNTGLDPQETFQLEPELGQREFIEVKIEKDRYGEYPKSYPLIFYKPCLIMHDPKTPEEKDFFYDKWINS